MHTIYYNYVIIKQAGDNVEYNFKTMNFEGPLDLLLHLIKQEDINIFEIKISDIIKQYLTYINKMREINLNISSEYLTVAADLIEIKSRELLPNNEEEEEEEDPKEKLINRLLEYQAYKEICKELKEMEEERNKEFSKSPTFMEEYKESKVELSQDVTLDQLIKAFQNLYVRKELSKPLNTVVTKKEYSVHKRNKEILTILGQKNKIAFEDLFEIPSKDYVVVTFLSILDLAKKGNLIIQQKENLSHIILQAKEV